ncbi:MULTISPECIES: VWA domain-containing protein [unclassified Neorhizobium]|uniref:VWA domain-containing protein n=1 Tax=unclassified Neorhizobium TaxID=2629175 RepID=UPI001FF2B6A2|nr:MULTISPECIES: VWA domain-containing protein [unclassified Neorhizobium]MCJ9672317.1 VWA domain-containing protein [Neorhizobium sp. SHOUNA12B]MCJ9748134.1 VWA domain-containing protein [Neorhizobium sp. SHOUNA12A]
MTDEFDQLGNLAPAPRASDATRARALAAAMQAFDETEKNAARSKGSSWRQRQSSVLNRIWSIRMVTQHRYLAGSALATMLIIPTAALLTFELTRGNLPSSGQVALPQVIDAPKPVAERVPVPSVAKPAEPQQEADRKAYAAPSVQSSKQRDFSSADIARQLKKQEANGGAAKRSAAPSPSVAPMPAPPVMAERAAPMAAAPRYAPTEREILPPLEETRDRFANADTNPVKSVAIDPVSTFSVDVDTASYAFARRSLMEGHLPDPDSVRVEEMINYFPYDWPRPQTADEPFRTTVTVTPTPWNTGTRLMHVAIKGFETAPASQPAANLVFLIDVSGSMNASDKLPLLKSAFRLLVSKLKPEDKVSIVTYAGNAGTVLEPTSARERDKILVAIDNLRPGGSTAGAEGIDAAYRLARRAFIQGGVNRVMLATDGDFNVGASSDEDLKRLIEQRRKDGIFLSVLGFGEGNLNDSLMQTLAQNGNGTAAYIDTLAEAQKALVEEAGSTLFPIAKDVKIQVEFNPQQISEYRLVGYETRALKREDFNNDRVDAGDVGSGHAVTAIYEVTPKGSASALNDPLRYGPAAPSAPVAVSDEMAFVKIRYKQPDGDSSKLITTPVTEMNAVRDFASAPNDVRFSTAVAAFGQKLRGTDALDAYPYRLILDMARNARGEDAFGYRGGFLDLVRLAETLDRR